MKKKIISIVIILTIYYAVVLTLLFQPFEKNGDVYTTDIGALIDEQPIVIQLSDHTIYAEDCAVTL